MRKEYVLLLFLIFMFSCTSERSLQSGSTEQIEFGKGPQVSQEEEARNIISDIYNTSLLLMVILIR